MTGCRILSTMQEVTTRLTAREGGRLVNVESYFDCCTVLTICSSGESFAGGTHGKDLTLRRDLTVRKGCGRAPTSVLSLAGCPGSTKQIKIYAVTISSFATVEAVEYRYLRANMGKKSSRESSSLNDSKTLGKLREKRQIALR